MYNHNFSLEKMARVFLLSFALITPLYLVFCEAGLFADGSHFLYWIIKGKTFHAFATPRLFSHYLLQILPVTSVKLDLTNRSLIIFIHSFNLIMLPAFIWWLAMWTVRKKDLFWAVTLLYSVIYLNSCFFFIGEYNFCYSLFALILILLVDDAPLDYFRSFAILILSILLSLSYEATVILGPLLICLMIYRTRNSALTSSQIFLYLSSTIITLGTIYAFSSVVSHRDSLAIDTATNPHFIFQNWQLFVSCMAIIFYLIPFWLHNPKLQMAFRGVALIILLGLIFTPKLWAEPQHHYFGRSLVGFILLVGSFFIIRMKGLKSHSWQVWSFPFLLFVGLSIPLVYHGYGFKKFVGAFRSEIQQHSGVIPLESTSLFHHGAGLYGWTWAYPVMSKVLGQSPENATIQVPAGFSGWTPEL